jgi:hypothetical protein
MGGVLFNCGVYEISLILRIMPSQSFDWLLSDDQMLAQLQRGETFSFKFSKWQLIERQIERLGFEDCYIVTQIDSVRGTLTKVSPTQQTEARRAA